MDACAEEKMHLFSDYIGAFLSPRTAYFSPSTPGRQSVSHSVVSYIVIPTLFFIYFKVPTGAERSVGQRPCANWPRPTPLLPLAPMALNAELEAATAEVARQISPFQAVTRRPGVPSASLE